MLRDVIAQLQQIDATGDINLEVLIPRFTITGLAKDLSDSRSLPRRHVSKALSLCLMHTERIERVPGDDAVAAQMASHVAELFSRSPSGLPHHHSPSDDAASAEDILAVLRALAVNYSAPIDDDTLLSVAAYTDGYTAWSTDAAASTAQTLLDHALIDENRKRVFITSVVLEGFIRSVFSHSSSSRTTSTGRKAHYVDDDPDCAEQSIMAKGIDAVPWKTVQLHAITVFSWAVKQSNEHLIGQNWPLYTPVLLALTDDTDTKFKAKGLAILQDFLARCPPRVLHDTGLGEIFEQSIFPSLMSLPTLTPEEESLQLLDPAFGAAIRLANVQFPDEKNMSRRNRLFTRILREGVLSGYWYACEYPKIVELLAHQASLVVQHLGTFTIPHVQEVLSMCAAIMTDPFFVSHPSCLQATSQALSALMLNCWPRISQPAHSGEVLRAVSICWLNLKDEQQRGADSDVLQKALAAVSSLAPMMSAIFTCGNLSLQEQLYPLCDSEPMLLELFGSEEGTLQLRCGELKGRY